MYDKRRGFTLVEIAIVLVIIGLLLGGVLKGQEMVTNAKVRRIADDWNNISAAILTYQDRYQQLPGDDSQADQHVGAANSGNGNGYINGYWATSNTSAETRLIWDHLRRASLITGSGDTQPRHALGGMMGVQTGTIYGLRGHQACLQNLPGDYALLVDTKVDDGIPNAGTVRGHNTQTAYDSTGNYNLCARI